MTAANREPTTLGELFPADTEPPGPDVRAKVRLLVASYATGPDDCRLLLEVLGLLPVEEGPQPD
ncbi:hypothetical protein [Kitasatospora sp. NPDC002040]|uniref:hypothetical protein n=1 Tax=Kitasatospora sp. NPDC002040 TaxID=3154661 RepID=UPI003321F60F